MLKYTFRRAIYYRSHVSYLLNMRGWGK